MMSKSKAGKLLAKALNNSSREEAITAFGMAFAQAQREKISLASLHRIDVVETRAGIDPQRETELVQKYNRVLAKAKALTTQLAEHDKEHERLKALNLETLAQNKVLTAERDQALKHAAEAHQQAQDPDADTLRQRVQIAENKNAYLRGLFDTREVAHRKELRAARDALDALNAAHTLTPAQVERLKEEHKRALARCGELANIIADLRQA